MPELRITPQHLERDAYLYIRQSTPRQVLENTESTQRQYALRDRAVGLGWPLERIHVVDSDLGKSGSQSVGRDGFQKLVSEVALSKAGLVMGLEFAHPQGAQLVMQRLYEAGVWAIFSTLDPRVLQYKPGVLMTPALCEELLDRTEQAIGLAARDARSGRGQP